MLQKPAEFSTKQSFAPTLCACGCGRNLEPRVDGERPRIGGQEVNPDCYDRVVSEALDRHPAGTHGLHRR